MIASAQGMVQRLDTRQLPEISAGLQKNLASANKLVLSLDAVTATIPSSTAISTACWCKPMTRFVRSERSPIC